MNGRGPDIPPKPMLDSDLFANLPGLESLRNRCRRNRTVYLLVLLLPTAGGLVGAAAAGDGVRGFFLIGTVVWVVIGFILYSVKYNSVLNRYRNEYKRLVVPGLLARIDPGLRHDAEAGIPLVAFQNTELFTGSVDRFSSEDLIAGRFGKTDLRLAEVHAEERHESRDSKGDREVRYVTIFRGILLVADFHKHFRGRTFLFPDKAERLLGRHGRFLQKLGGRSQTHLIQLEDPEFEKAFAVYATDEVEARYLLSTSMMERLLRLRERFGKEVRMALKDSAIAVAVPFFGKFLEPELAVSASDPGQLDRIERELQAFLGIVTELDLNTRIWSKE